MVGVRCQSFDRLNVAAQFVSNQEPRRPELSDQPLDKPPCCLGVSSRLYKNIEYVPVGVYGAPKPAFLTSNLDDNFFEMPFVVGTRAIAPDAIGEMRTKAINPQPDRFPADNHTRFSQQVLNVGCAYSEAVVSPNSVRDDFAREAEAFQARHTEWDLHDVEIVSTCQTNKLAMPH